MCDRHESRTNAWRHVCIVKLGVHTFARLGPELLSQLQSGCKCHSKPSIVVQSLLGSDPVSAPVIVPLCAVWNAVLVASIGGGLGPTNECTMRLEDVVAYSGFIADALSLVVKLGAEIARVDDIHEHPAIALDQSDPKHHHCSSAAVRHSCTAQCSCSPAWHLCFSVTCQLSSHARIVNV